MVENWIPRFRANLQAFRVSMAGYCVVSEYDTYLLEGAAISAIASLVDGRRSVSQIRTLTQALVPAADFDSAFALLVDNGYLEPVEPQATEPILAFCHELNLKYSGALALLKQRRIELINLTTTPSAHLSALLTDSGVASGGDAYLCVVICDDYRDYRLHAVNQRMLAENRQWLLSRPAGHNFWIGPHFLPERSPCWSCLDQRLTLNRGFVEFAERWKGQRQNLTLNATPIFSCLYQAYGALVVTILRILLDRADADLVNQIVVNDTLLIRSSRHVVVKRPDCPTCGSPLQPQRQQYRPDQRTIVADNLTGIRREAPEVTYQKLRHHVSPLTGIVREIQPSPYNSTTPLRSYTAGHNFALTRNSPTALRDSIRALSSGKGRTEAEARTSALCEALERYCGVFQGTEARTLASFRSLGDDAIHPAKVMQFSDRQYQDRDLWNNRGLRFQVVPQPLDEDCKIEWSPIKSVNGVTTKFLPTSYLYYGYRHSNEEFFCWADSNGCASGTSRDDACVQGLLELVERDAAAIWWYNRLEVPVVDLSTIDDDYYARLEHFYSDINRTFWVIELTHDLQIPVYCALSRREEAPTEDIVMGFGAHIDPRIAVNRAVTELNQFMPALLQVSSDGSTMYGIDDRAALEWWTSATIDAHSYLSHPSMTTKRVHVPKGAHQQGAASMLELLVSRISSFGHDIFVCDQTRPDVGLPVVKMIVPGLRHFWARLGPGRLYDVPVEMGQLSVRKSEDELNPIPLFV